MWYCIFDRIPQIPLTIDVQSQATTKFMILIAILVICRKTEINHDVEKRYISEVLHEKNF